MAKIYSKPEITVMQIATENLMTSSDMEFGRDGRPTLKPDLKPDGDDWNPWGGGRRWH